MHRGCACEMINKMNTTLFFESTGEYVSPQCMMLDIQSEVLCASGEIDALDKQYYQNPWDY